MWPRSCRCGTTRACCPRFLPTQPRPWRFRPPISPPSLSLECKPIAGPGRGLHRKASKASLATPPPPRPQAAAPTSRSEPIVQSAGGRRSEVGTVVAFAADAENYPVTPQVAVRLHRRGPGASEERSPSTPDGSWAGATLSTFVDVAAGRWEVTATAAGKVGRAIVERDHRRLGLGGCLGQGAAATHARLRFRLQQLIRRSASAS